MLLEVVVFLLLALPGAMYCVALRWRHHTDRLRADLELSGSRMVAGVYDAAELEGLPAPVQRYFRTVLTEGQPLVRGARFSQAGMFNLGEAKAKWCLFSASQSVVMQRPGFVWDARIMLAPGLKVFVHDTYLAGEGILHASVLGVFTVAAQQGTTEMAQGELMRFLAEAAWYPTALLPSQGVRWEAIDATSALASLADAETTVALVFDFDAEGLICGVRASARHRMVNGENIPTPWCGRFWNYAERGGMCIPLEGEVAWMLPGGEWPYWRGCITDIRHELAD